MPYLLGLEVRLVDHVWFGCPSDQLLAHDAVVLEADINISARLINHDSALQRPVAPFLFCRGNGFYLSNLKCGQDPAAPEASKALERDARPISAFTKARDSTLKRSTDRPFGILAL